MKPIIVTAIFGDGEDGLGDADSAMGDATGRLGDGNADGAVDSQGKALEAMRKGAQSLAANAVLVETDDAMLLDIDKPDDLARAARQIST